MTKQKSGETRRFWDQEATTFDEEPDHGLRDPTVREAWRNRLARWLPHPPSTIVDIGCGTGSLSVLLAALGHDVTGVDLSPAMIAQARTKARAQGQRIDFRVMEAAHLQLAPSRFDALVCRHLLWALPEPAQVLGRWVGLLKPRGRMVLIEGYWHTEVGLRPAE